METIQLKYDRLSHKNVYAEVYLNGFGATQCRFLSQAELDDLTNSYSIHDLKVMRYKINQTFNKVTGDKYLLMKDVPTKKICLECCCRKSIDEFKPNAVSYDGYTNHCIECLDGVMKDARDVESGSKIICTICKQTLDCIEFDDSIHSVTGKSYTCVSCTELKRLQDKDKPKVKRLSNSKLKDVMEKRKLNRWK